MAGYDRLTNPDGAESSVLVIVKIRAADAACGHLQQHLAIPRCGNVGDLQPKIAWAVKPGKACAHGCSRHQRISPTDCGSHNTTAGTKVIRMRAMNSGTSHGRIAIVVRSTESFATRDSTKSTMPSGG
ncbi:hypothetical protein ACVMB3_006381 [Sinorhizobium meliloti]